MVGRSILILTLSLTAPGRRPAAGGDADPPKPPSTVAEPGAAARSYGEKADVIQESDRWFIEHCRKFVEKGNALAATATALAGHHDRPAEQLAERGRVTAPRA